MPAVLVTSEGSSMTGLDLTKASKSVWVSSAGYELPVGQTLVSMEGNQRHGAERQMSAQLFGRVADLHGAILDHGLTGELANMICSLRMSFAMDEYE